MKKFPQLIAMTTFALATGSAGVVYADGLYIGAGIYQADAEKGSFDDDDTVGAFFAGYTFIDTNIFMLSGELGYYDLGGYKGNIGNANYDVDAAAYTLAGVGYLPLGPFFELYAKAGIAAVDVDVNSGDLNSDNGGKAFGGIGASIDVLDTIDIYAEYLAFDTTVSSSVAGVGVRFAF